MVTSGDFELGGIMNPYNDIYNVSELLPKCKSLISSFPYISRNQIKTAVYKSPFDQIFYNLKEEITSDLLHLKQSKNLYILESIADNCFSIKTLKSLKNHFLYQKILALHLCGFGEFLQDAFNNILEYFLNKDALFFYSLK